METKKWTIMVYLAGDNDLDEDGTARRSSKVIKCKKKNTK